MLHTLLNVFKNFYVGKTGCYTRCPVNFGCVEFELDLVCLPLTHMDVIFGMDWMLTFGVNINC